MCLKYSINFTIAFSKSLKLYQCHNLPGISEKVQITARFQKTEFDKYATSRVSAFSLTSICLIQFIMDQNCHSRCYKQTAMLKIGY